MANNPGTPQQPQVRTLKIYDKIFCRGGSFITGNRYTITFPEIRLMGKWLQDCGFEPGQHIEVTTEHNKLTITPAWFEKEEDE